MIRRRNKRLLSIIGIGIMTILLSYISTYDPSSLSYFSPTEKSVDFQSSDFYQLVANSRNEHYLDDKIVIVPIDSLSRLDLALLIEDISLCNPSVIGVDVDFPFSSECDSLLLAIINRAPSIVLPMEVVRKQNCQQRWTCINSRLFDKLNNDKRGIVNLNISHPYNVVRSFIPFYDTDRGVVANFVTSIAMLTDTTKSIKNELLKSSEVEIDFASREFNIIPPSNILSNIDEIENKIVLLGAISESQDMHITPIDDTTPGVIIHANALSTILHKTYLKHLPTWMSWILGFFLCSLFVIAYSFFNRFQAGNMFMRLFQILLVFFMIFLGCTLFLRYHLVFELSFPLILAALGIVAIDFWNGFIWILQSLGLSIDKKD